MSTIAAISTPSGIGGIAVVRLSGSEAFAIASRHLVLPKPNEGRPATAFTHVTCIFEVIMPNIHVSALYIAKALLEITVPFE